MGRIIECSLVADSDLLDDIIEFIGHEGAVGTASHLITPAVLSREGEYHSRSRVSPKITVRKGGSTWRGIMTSFPECDSKKTCEQRTPLPRATR